MEDFCDENAKEEIPNLRERLESNNPSDRHKAIKRVLSLMRSGESLVSSLFTSMLRCVRTDDVKLKKLVYLYLITFSSSEPEQSIMAVNAFIKDSEDPSPIVRALAVRTMCRIKHETVAEYMIVPLKKRLLDESPYVRKTSALAVSKLYEIIPEAVEASGLLQALVNLLNDDNPMVISNATAALFEINGFRTTPYFVLNEVNVTPVISAMSQCSDWVQAVLLDALGQYKPATDQEATFLIDRLIPFMKNSNPAVVVGAFKCVYTFMDNDKRNHGEIFKMILPPFITLILNSRDPEVSFVVLRCLSLFAKKYPKSLQKDIRIFFCKYNEPCYIKVEKLEIIVSLITPTNAATVVNEIEEYTNDVDVQFVRKAVRCLGRIVERIPVSSRRIVDILVRLFDSKSNYAIESAIIVFSDVLRLFPSEFDSVIEKALGSNSIESIRESESRAACVWIIGEYCYLIDKADVLLDPFLDTFHDEDPEVQLQIITATVKVYLTAGQNAKDQLQFLMEEATKDTVLPDVRNRALIYWRLLTLDQETAKDAILKEKRLIAQDENIDKTVLEALILNMGRVSGIFHILPEDFVKSHLIFSPDADSELIDNNGGYNYSNNNTSLVLNGSNDTGKNWTKAIIKDDDNIVDVFTDWEESKLWIKVVNKGFSQENLTDFAIAINKNCLGLEIKNSEEIRFPAKIEYGESFEICLNLTYSNSCINKDLFVLQAALRTSKGTKMFNADIDIICFTQDISFDIGIAQFNGMWNELPELMQTIDDSVEGGLVEGEKAEIAEVGILSGRGLKVIEEGNAQKKEWKFVFSLPIDLIYLAIVKEKENGAVEVRLRGDQSLFPLLKQNIKYLFCKESNLVQ